MKRMKSIDEASNIPPEDWAKVLKSMKSNADETRIMTFSTEKTQSWVYRLWMRLKEGQ